MIRLDLPMAACLAAISIPVPAMAQRINCPSELARLPNGEVPRPMPSIVSYTVTPSRPPADQNEARRWQSAPNEATVIGGHATIGALVITINLSDAVGRECDWPVQLVDTARSDLAARGVNGELEELALPRRGWILGSIGTAQLVWTIPTRLVAREKRLTRLAIRMGERGTLHPITVILQPPPPPVVTLQPIGSMIEVRASSAMPLNAEMPSQDREVTFTLSPPSIGTWVSGRSSGAVATTVFEDNFTPSRSSARLQPGVNTTTSPAQVTVRFGGHSIAVPLPIPAGAPPPPPPAAASACSPAPVFSARPGRVHIGIGNTGKGPCSAMMARFAPGGSAAMAVKELVAGSRPPAVGKSAPPPTFGRIAIADGWQGEFPVAPSATILPTARFSLTLTPDKGGAPFSFAYVPSAAELAILRSKGAP